MGYWAHMTAKRSKRKPQQMHSIEFNTARAPRLQVRSLELVIGHTICPCITTTTRSASAPNTSFHTLDSALVRSLQCGENG